MSKLKNAQVNKCWLLNQKLKSGPLKVIQLSAQWGYYLW